MLSLADKSDIRRHLRYEVIGLPQVGPASATFAMGTVGYRFFQAYGRLEYRMNNLNVDEEARTMGRVYGGIALVGLQPNPGDTLTVHLSGGNLTSPQTITVTAQAPVAGQDGRLSLLQLLTNAVASNAVVQTALMYAVSPYGTGPFAQQAIPLPEMAITSPVPFTMTASGTGLVAPQITNLPGYLEPSTTLDGTTTIRGYIPILNGLQGAFASASQNLDTKQAAVWYSRANEIGLRMSLYRNWQDMFSEFIGIPINPDRRDRALRRGALRYA